MSLSLPGRFGHPSWLSAAGTLVGYLAFLVVMTAVLFLVPYLVFIAL